MTPVVLVRAVDPETPTGAFRIALALMNVLRIVETVDFCEPSELKALVAALDTDALVMAADVFKDSGCQYFEDQYEERRDIER
jgi:hypothetical protein